MPRTKTIGEPIPTGILTTTDVSSQEAATENQFVEGDAVKSITQSPWPQAAVGMLLLPAVAWTAGVTSYLNFLHRLQTDWQASVTQES